MAKRFMYVSLWDHNPPKSKGIDIYEFDTETGALAYKKMVYDDVAFNMSKIDPAKGEMLVLNETEHVPDVGYSSGRLYCFGLDAATGDIAERWHITTGCPSPDYFDFSGDGRYLVVSHHSCPERVTKFRKNAEGKWIPTPVINDSALQLYEMNADGTVGELLDVIDLEPEEVVLDKKGHPNNNHPHSCLRAPLYKNLFCVPDKGDGTVSIYTIDEETKTLKLCSKAVTDTPKDKSRYVCFHPTKPFFFINHENNRGEQFYCSSFKYFEDGSIERIGVYEGLCVPMDLNEINSQQGLQISPDGKYLYSSCRNPRVIIVYAIDQETGALKMIQNAEVPGDFVRAIGITPDGKFLVSGCLFDGAVNVFAVGEDGKLTLTEHKATSVGASYISFYDVP